MQETGTSVPGETEHRNGAAKGCLYEKVAARIGGMIESGTYQAGDRLPSVRELSRRMQVSINTVTSAYVRLENLQLIEARPRSGYFVRSHVLELGTRKAATRDIEAKPVVIADRQMRIVRSLGSRSLVPLGTGAPNAALLPIGRLSRILAAQVRRHSVESVSYAPPAGFMWLRQQIAKRQVAAGCTVAAEDVIVTSGCVEAVTLALQAACEPGQTVAIASPVYYSFLNLIQWLGLNVLEIPACPREGLSLDVLAYALRHNPVHACVVIANFNNPLGSVMPDDAKRRLAEMAAKHRIALIENDVYGDLSFAAARPPSIKAFDRDGWVIQCSSFSKTLAPGYRTGWMVPGRFQQKALMLKQFFNVATSSPAQLAIAEFLANGGYERHLRGLCRAYAQQMANVRDAIGRHFPPGTRVTRPEGGSVLWVEMPEAVDACQLYEQALERGIGIAPGPLFTTGSDFANCIRLSAVFWDSRVEDAIRVTGELAAAQAAAGQG